MQITYFGQSCFQIETEGHTILFDPFIRPNPLAGDVDVDTINPGWILVSHAHMDHTADLKEIAERSGAVVVANADMANYMGKNGYKHVHPMNTGGTWSFPWGSLHMVRADHSSSWPDGTYGGNPQGFVLTMEGKRIYYSGDTAYFSDMALYGEDAPIDIAMVCLGDNFTMGIKDAARTAAVMNAKHAIAMHYDTFGYIMVNRDEARAAFEAKGVQLAFIEIGGMREY